MKPTNVTGYPFSNGDRLTAVSVNQICNALDAIQDYNDTIKEFEDLVEENTEKLKQQISATTESTAEVVRSMDSVSLASDVQQGKNVIAQAINAKGGSASATESFSELAQAVEEIPNFSDMVKLACIIAGGYYNKDALQGHNENVKYGKTEIVDRVGAFEKINVSYCFQYWDLLKSVTMNALTSISGSNVFSQCTALQSVELNSVTSISGLYSFYNAPQLQNIELGTLITINAQTLYDAKPHLRNITIGQDTDIDLPFQQWTATNVIAEGQSGIDELNSNLYNNLLTKLYDHSEDGETRTLRIGWLANVTQENIDYANAKGWTLTT